MKKTLGGDRLGSGKKQEVDLHGYERSTHDLGYLWRSTMSAGTLVPFMSEVALPGDTFDINLEADIKTHPTTGPLFGSHKVQLDIFQAPIRLYQGALHNNKLGIGMNMSAVKLPLITLEAIEPNDEAANDIDNYQINPSCILAYLGIRGVGVPADPTKTRTFNAIPLLAYWEIYKNYYANKQEELGAVIHTPLPLTPVQTIDGIDYVTNGVGGSLAAAPAYQADLFNQTTVVQVNYTGAPPIPETILVTTDAGITYRLIDLFYTNADDGGTTTWNFNGYRMAQFGPLTIRNWRYMTAADQVEIAPAVEMFDLNEIDEMREAILAQAGNPAALDVNALGFQPYNWVIGSGDGEDSSKQYSQEGLGLKTYQSDLFNNWLSTEWIDGPGGINDITAIDTSGGSFNIDTLNLSKKVYEMLNRIAVSGGTYDDWLDAVYTHERIMRAESPIYHGGLIRELVFQEVISNSDTETPTGQQPLGTLAGRGIMAQKKKGGYITVKVDEPSYIIGIISLTPRIDYSQGNKWDVHLETMDDFHKPGLDEIGFQELITEQMAWWSTTAGVGGDWTTRSAGKQPAWINYMTNVNRTLGNFAIRDNEMFMTLNRRYEADPGNFAIADLTTYIDPTKFNFIFAQTALDAQNYWAQISVDITARRKMSAKVMPNL